MLSLLGPANRRSEGACLGIDPLIKLGHAGNRRFNRLVLARATRDKTSSARGGGHVLGHNFAPFAFQEPGVGFIVVNTV